MKRTSRSQLGQDREVAGAFDAGPDVTCSVTPISAAAMPASVLPSPGDPPNSRWSTAWPRRAASMTMPRCSLVPRWPTKSASRQGGRLGDVLDVVGDPGSRNSSRRAPSSEASRNVGASDRSAARAGPRGSPRAVAEAGQARDVPDGAVRPAADRIEHRTDSGFQLDGAPAVFCRRRHGIRAPYAAGDDVDRAPADASQDRHRQRRPTPWVDQHLERPRSRAAKPYSPGRPRGWVVDVEGCADVGPAGSVRHDDLIADAADLQQDDAVEPAEHLATQEPICDALSAATGLASGPGEAQRGRRRRRRRRDGAARSGRGASAPCARPGLCRPLPTRPRSL